MVGDDLARVGALRKLRGDMSKLSRCVTGPSLAGQAWRWLLRRGGRAKTHDSVGFTFLRQAAA